VCAQQEHATPSVAIAEQRGLAGEAQQLVARIPIFVKPGIADQVGVALRFLADRGAKIEIWNRKNKFGWTPFLIAEGHRPGNFKPSFETIAALHEVMLAAGVTPPVNTPPSVTEDRDDYRVEKANKTTGK
jgi:hypothetical protein